MRRVLNEGMVMRFGGRGDSPDNVQPSAIDAFCRMAMDNSVFGHNAILERLSRFDNSAMFSAVDDEPELDEYVQTLFLDNLGDHGYDVNGDPYGEFKKMQGELSGEPAEREAAAVPAQSAMEFMNAFGKIFAR